MEKEVVRAGLAELVRLQSGGVPDPAELAVAPVLSDWMVSPDGSEIRLVGTVSGHPSIEDGWCTTSPVLVIADDMSWARTVSRYYRLGDRMRSDG